MVEPMAAATRASSTQLFIALSGAFLISALCSLVAGRWIDRRGGREVLVAASVLLAGALGLMAVARGPTMALAGVLSLGLGMGVGLYPAANAILVSAFDLQAKRPITAVALIGACGGAVGWPLTLWLIQTLGWREACLVWAGLHLALCIPLYLVLLPSGRGVGAGRPKDRVRWDRPMVQLALLFAGAWWLATACAAHMPRILMALGLSVQEAAFWAGSMALAVIAVRGLALIMPASGHPVLMVRLGSVLHPLGVVIALIGGKAFSLVIPVAQGAGNGLLSVATGLMPLHVWGPSHYGQRQVMMLLPARFVQAIAPMTYAVALDHSTGLALGLGSVICLAMFALSFGLIPRGAQGPVLSGAKGA